MIKILLVVISLCCFAACSGVSKKNKREMREVFISDNHRTTKNGEILIDDGDLDYNQIQFLMTGKSILEMPKSATDNSEIIVMIDGFGNKIETRNFLNHPLLQRVVLRTFVNGQTKAFVYGQNGEVNSLPDDLRPKAMTAPAGYLAKSAGISTGRESLAEPYFLCLLRQKNEPTILSTPDYEYSVAPIVIERVDSAETTEKVKTTEIAKVTEKTQTITQISPVTQVKVTTPRDFQTEINRLSLKSIKPKKATEED